MEQLFFFLIVGAFGGFLSGLLGIGGGLVIVPALSWFYSGQDPEQAMHLAVGTSVACIALTTLSSLWKHARLDNLRGDVLKQLLPAMGAGAFLGVFITNQLPGEILERFFAVFALLIAVKMMLQGKTQLSEQQAMPAPGTLSVYGGIIGTIAALLGLGGGVMVVPMLSHFQLKMRYVVGISSACSFFIAVSCVLSRFLLSMIDPSISVSDGLLIDWNALIGIAVASVIFAPLGAHASVYCPNNLLRRLFAVVLTVVAIEMLLS